MARRHEETSAHIRFEGAIRLSGAQLARALVPTFEAEGAVIAKAGALRGSEAYFAGPSLRIRIGPVPGSDRDISVLIETPVDAPAPRETAAQRMRLCGAAVAHFVRARPASHVLWQHKGARYRSAAGAATEVEHAPVRRFEAGTGTGEQARQKSQRRIDAAKRALPLPPPPAAPRQPVSDAARSDLAAAARSRAHARLAQAGRRPDPRGELRRSLPGKLTLYTMNTTLCVMALPVGAGMMTYNVLSGGSVVATARAMALTGLALALGGSPVLGQLTAML
ncbi:MAG: hypothetical protein ACU0AT_00795 [Tranquillimonas sp.]